MSAELTHSRIDFMPSRLPHPQRTVSVQRPSRVHRGLTPPNLTDPGLRRIEAHQPALSSMRGRRNFPLAKVGVEGSNPFARSNT